MKKLLLTTLTLALAATAHAAVSLGAYDYEQTFLTSKTMAYEEIFVSWNSYTPGTILSQLNAIRSRGRWPLFTCQPYHINIIGNADTLLSDIAAGKYDGTIGAVCSEIRAYDGPVVIRWGHEMELASNIGRYDWATTNYRAYIAAYHKAISVFRSYLSGISNVYYVWSPAGNSNCNNYYPGNGYCDFCGCSLYSWSAYDVPNNINGSFSALFSSKYNVLATHNKSIMVCECGIEVADPQAAWIAAAKAAFATYPLLSAVVYFNAPDSVAWWTGGPVPSWVISPTIWN